MVRIADDAARWFDNQVPTADLLRRSQLTPVESAQLEFGEAIFMDDDRPLDLADDNPSTSSGQADVSDYLYYAADTDPAASLQHNRTRWFDPTVGLWLSTDPVGYAPSDKNLYRYVANDPHETPEPDGL